MSSSTPRRVGPYAGRRHRGGWHPDVRGSRLDPEIRSPRTDAVGRDEPGGARRRSATSELPAAHAGCARTRSNAAPIWAARSPMRRCRRPGYPAERQPERISRRQRRRGLRVDRHHEPGGAIPGLRLRNPKTPEGRSCPDKGATPIRTTVTALSRPTTARLVSSHTGTAASSRSISPTPPTREFQGATTYPANADGDAHSSSYNDGATAALLGRRGLL